MAGKAGESNSEMLVGTHYVVNEAGTRLALTYLPAFKSESTVSISCKLSDEQVESQQSSAYPVLLTHGTFSNHRSCRGLAQYLSKRGFDCWILDMQGHGFSDKPTVQPTFESMCLQDTGAALDFLQKQYPDTQVHWVGHSGGGLAILMYLARHPDQQNRLGKIVTLASQATHAGKKPLNRVAIKLSAIITKLLKVAPGRWLKIGPENEFASVMLQWYQWSLEEKWLGHNGLDYEAALEQVQRPLLSIAAGGDTFIAPVEGCRHLYKCYGGEQKEFHFCAKSSGYKEDYTHSRIISSSSAAKEVWPMVSDWLQSPMDLS